MFKFLWLFLFPLIGVAHSLQEDIAQLFILAFKGDKLTQNTLLDKEIKSGLGGVILLGEGYDNIKNPKQLKVLNHTIQKHSKTPLFICVDQEGGRIVRLKEEMGFFPLNSAKTLGNINDVRMSELVYKSVALEMKKVGINCLFAPVVDVDRAYNPIIHRYERSYGPIKVIKQQAKVVLKVMKSQGILSVLKHFPGHGSSKTDSHKGFTNVTAYWSREELIPYTYLIKRVGVDAIMTAHIYNKHLDPLYPGSLSYKINTELLKKKMHYKGLLISDDLMMHAITKSYNLSRSIELSLRSGVDMLLLIPANPKELDLKKLEKIVLNLIKKGKISASLIHKKAKKIRQIKALYQL